MSDDLVKQYIAELQDLVRCRCHAAYKRRGLHDPICCCDYAEALKVVSDRIKELETNLSKALTALGDVQRFVRDLEPYADQGHSLVPALEKACATYMELKGETNV